MVCSMAKPGHQHNPLRDAAMRAFDNGIHVLNFEALGDDDRHDDDSGPEDERDVGQMQRAGVEGVVKRLQPAGSRIEAGETAPRGGGEATGWRPGRGDAAGAMSTLCVATRSN